ncbi:hypothetical protein [Candidatus Spongiihabitans sp.]|uniref:hypothetical protein n=1 Tax=Candidatus Spongiihabitans sp. TaxID=3101308 RepID=UPI003C7A260B
MVNSCHAKRDTKTCSGVARHSLSCALASQLVFALSIHYCLSFVIARPLLLLAGQSSGICRPA